MKNMKSLLLAAMTVGSMALSVPVMADDAVETDATTQLASEDSPAPLGDSAAAQAATVPPAISSELYNNALEPNAQGVVDFNEGANGKITINGADRMPLKGKYFMVYRLFNSVSSADGKSIDYKWDPAYQPAIQQAVAAGLTKSSGKEVKPADVTLKMALDYIDSLKVDSLQYPEGTTQPQPLQPDTSAFRYFVEQVRDAITTLKEKGTLVCVGNNVAADNSIVLDNIKYGYYLIDEITSAGLPTGTAASLNMVTTANPESTMKIKASAPTIIKQVGEDDPVPGIAANTDPAAVNLESSNADLPYYYNYVTDPGQNGGDYAWPDGVVANRKAVEAKLAGQDEVSTQADSSTTDSSTTDSSTTDSTDPKTRKLTWNDVADVEIGQTVPFRFIATVPNMNGYSKYKFIVHDKMDKALTFKPETLTLTISGQVGGTPKTYTLKADEFSVNTNPGNGETFTATIDDLKALIDREFDNKDANGINVYDQTITYRFDCVLNDNAANDTGRPGFENSVKLEFSSNPDGSGSTTPGQPGPGDETNDTPWDTVVVFTFKIDALKVDDKNATLEGATFRLYSDEACTNEVYVKAGPDGSYIVINRDSAGGDDHTGGSAPADATVMTSGKDGTFKIVGLDQGTYWLKEISAPDGYKPLEAPIKVTITPTYDTDNRNDYEAGDGATDKTLTGLTGTADYNGSSSNLKTDVEEGSLNLKVVNGTGSLLPSTGNWVIYPMLGVGALLVIGGVAYSKKRSAK